MTYKNLIGNNSKGVFYTIFIFIIIFVYLRRERLKGTRINSKAKFLNVSSEKTGRRPVVPLLRSTCFPTNPNRSYDGDFPDVFDWRSKGAVGPVIDQLNCNACWAISILGMMESMVAIDQLARGVFHGVTTLSVQEMIDCSYRKGCLMGDPRSALEDMMERNMSVVTDDQYPLTLRQEDCKIPENVRPKGVTVRSFEVHCSVSPETMMSLIYHHGPVAVTVNTAQWMYYTDGIIARNCPHDVQSNHVAQIVGYDHSGEIPYYIVKNSWGTDFGIGGYLKIRMRDNLCGIEDYVTSVDVRTYD